MSRRPPNPAAERAAQNQQTIKSLLKLDANKVCADCKRNKHPRWASWNLGVFVCIRCSGIHRGMGTHISRVKSVDLDSWTEEQMKSILSWGNARANKYWEAKLAPGHVPSESKIENFIRTKYELKRWAMDGPIPDPATIDADGDDNVPLSAVKEKQSINRSASAGTASAGQASARRPAAPPVVDLIGGVENTPPRASTTGPPATGASRVPPKADPAPPKATPSNASLLGLDFLGESSAPPRPASTGASTPGVQSRPDLKQSILSLYASAPKPQPPQQAQHQQQSSFGGMNSPPFGHQQQGSVGGFNDAFSNLSIASGTTSPPPPAADPFASLGSPSSRGPPAQKPGSHSSFGSLGGGSFFAPKPSQPSPSLHQKKPSDGGFGDFGSFASPAPAKPAQPTTTSHTGDLFDLAAPVSQTTTSPPPTTTSPPAATSSVFNLSSTQNNTAPQTSPPKNTATPAFAAAGIAGADVWGGGAWGAPEPAAPAAPAAASNPPATSSSSLGWGATGGSFASTPIIPGSGGGFNVQPKVAADEEFGGWASSTGPSTSTAASKPPASGNGFGAVDEDLFSNVWQ